MKQLGFGSGSRELLRGIYHFIWVTELPYQKAILGMLVLTYEVEHINVDKKEYGIKSIKVSWCPLDEVILNYSSDLFAKLVAIDEIDLLLGGDHGKGVLNFLVVFIVRYEVIV